MKSGKAVGGVDPSKLERIKKGIKSINITGKIVNKNVTQRRDGHTITFEEKKFEEAGVTRK